MANIHRRYLVICHPMKAQSVSTPGRAKRTIGAVWVTAILLSSVIVLFVSGVSIKSILLIWLIYAT